MNVYDKLNSLQKTIKKRHLLYTKENGAKQSFLYSIIRKKERNR